MKYALVSSVVWILLGVHTARAQQTTPCRVLCTPELKVEPTITFTNLFGAPGTNTDPGAPTREPREIEFELILSLGLPTRLSWLDFTVEAIFQPFNADSTPELEFETNFVWLPAQRTDGWLSSHCDVVDKFSRGERPTDRRAYTHKLNLELDTSVAISIGSRMADGCAALNSKAPWTTLPPACRKRVT